jgi:hypothetical protein
MASFSFSDKFLNPLLAKRERIASDGTVKKLTASAYTSDNGFQSGKVNDKLADAAMIMVYTNAINFTIDGTDPQTASALGFEAAPLDIIYLTTPQQIKAFKFIQKTAGGAIEVQYFFGS